jgi:hypothetical protein
VLVPRVRTHWVTVVPTASKRGVGG